MTLLLVLALCLVIGAVGGLASGLVVGGLVAIVLGLRRARRPAATLAGLPVVKSADPTIPPAAAFGGWTTPAMPSSTPPRRCARLTSERGRCHRWALPGEEFCFTHLRPADKYRPRRQVRDGEVLTLDELDPRDREAFLEGGAGGPTL